jgi:uncharacterized protein with FMN-binding domain
MHPILSKSGVEPRQGVLQFGSLLQGLCVTKSFQRWLLISVSAVAGMGSTLAALPSEQLFPTDQQAEGLDGLIVIDPAVTQGSGDSPAPAQSQTGSDQPNPATSNAPGTPSAPSQSTKPGTKPSTPQKPTSPSKPPTQPSTPPASPTAPAGGGGSTGVSGTFAGDVVSARSQYGNVQVQITVVNSKITDIQFLELPARDGESRQISQEAAPWLRDQALKSQSTAISGVSGATYTTRAFKSSLQSAITKAGL